MWQSILGEQPVPAVGVVLARRAAGAHHLRHTLWGGDCGAGGALSGCPAHVARDGTSVHASWTGN